jgi:hypothetical protein
MNDLQYTPITELVHKPEQEPVIKGSLVSLVTNMQQLEKEQLANQTYMILI